MQPEQKQNQTRNYKETMVEDNNKFTIKSAFKETFIKTGKQSQSEISGNKYQMINFESSGDKTAIQCRKVNTERQIKRRCYRKQTCYQQYIL